ncbi:MAG: DMT family transporter [Anaerolineae bacterium]|nr:DMT family transporter [Anaerolineae bacterium]
MQPKHWTLFILLGLIWSASFLWIKIALIEIGPFTLVAYRLILSLLSIGAVVFIKRETWPRGLAGWWPFILIGLGSLAIPFYLISWGTLSIDSTVVSILNALAPLFTIGIAHLFLADDKITAQRMFGLLLGFAGVVVLLSKDINSGEQSSLLGQGAVILATIFYAASSVYARSTTKHSSPVVVGAATLVSATAISWIAAPLLENPVQVPTLPLTWIALLWLGVLGSGLALILFYYLLHEIGPTRTMMVTYLLPPIGVLLGVVFLKEELSLHMIIGGLFIVISIIVVNWKQQ